jgi:hypothetical protein
VAAALLAEETERLALLLGMVRALSGH